MEQVKTKDGIVINNMSRRYRWDTMLKRWQFYMDSYLGGDDYKYSTNEQYLMQGKTEKTPNFKSRIEMAAFVNMCRPIITEFLRYIYSEPINRKGLDKVIPLINFAGTPDKYFGTCFTYWGVYGEMFTQYLVDKDEYIEQGLTLADLKNLREDEYLINVTAVPPTFCPYFYQNEYVIYNPINYEMPEQLANFYATSDRVVDYYGTNRPYYVWTGQEMTVYMNNTKKEVYPHNYGQTPFIRLMIDENKNNIGESFLKDIADLNKVIYNILSATTDEVINSSFSSLVYPWSQKIHQMLEGILPKMQMSDGTEEIILDPKEVMLAPMSEDIQQFPFYLNRSVDGLDTKMEYMRFVEDKINTLSGKRISEMINRSGIAEAYQFQSYNAQLKFLSTVMESYETKVFQTIIDYLGLDVPEWSIEYPKSFDLVDNIEKIKLIDALMNRSDIPPSAKKAATRKYIKILLNPNEELMGEINDEIDNEVMQEVKEENPINEIKEEVKEDETNETKERTGILFTKK